MCYGSVREDVSIRVQFNLIILNFIIIIITHAQNADFISLLVFLCRKGSQCWEACIYTDYEDLSYDPLTYRKQHYAWPSYGTPPSPKEKVLMENADLSNSLTTVIWTLTRSVRTCRILWHLNCLAKSTPIVLQEQCCREVLSWHYEVRPASSYIRVYLCSLVQLQGFDIFNK
jgi:hypothetical protein